MIHQRLMNCTEARMMEFRAKILVVVLVSVISWFGFRLYRCKADRERKVSTIRVSGWVHDST